MLMALMVKFVIIRLIEGYARLFGEFPRIANHQVKLVLS